METIIDIQLVKEQLRLLGHNVADEVILDFVKGLNKPPGTCCCCWQHMECTVTQLLLSSRSEGGTNGHHPADRCCRCSADPSSQQCSS